MEDNQKQTNEVSDAQASSVSRPSNWVERCAAHTPSLPLHVMLARGVGGGRHSTLLASLSVDVPSKVIQSSNFELSELCEDLSTDGAAGCRTSSVAWADLTLGLNVCWRGVRAR